jgi:ribulose 1,5-bisphosphate carboxylase large subunit-like protein
MAKNDYDDLKSTGKLDQILGELKANLDFAKDNEIYTESSYRKLADKYEEAMKLIETLKSKIEDLQKNKIPTKDEVESMSAMLDLLDKFDPKTLEKIASLGGDKK